MRKNRAMTHTVAVLALDHVVAFDLGVPPAVFRAARDAAGRRLYRVLVCGAPARSTAGFTVVPEHDLSALETADTVLVPGVDGGPAVTDGTVDPARSAERRVGQECRVGRAPFH